MPSEPGESLVGVSETALGAAEMRAEESGRPDRLFDDPYASAFVAAAPPLFPDIPSISDDAELAALVAASIAEIAIRTRFYDDSLSTACAAGCRQVVLLAAGLDTRAFRLDWPAGVRIFELDLPELFEFKERVLTRQGATPKCSRTVVGVDLREDWPARLTGAGFDPSLPTAWAAEGLLAYLSNDDARRLLTAVGELSTGGSRLSFEYDEFADDSTLSRARAMPGMQEVASMWQGGLSEHPEEWLRRHDWEVRTYARAELALTYGRRLAHSATGGFVTARRRPGWVLDEVAHAGRENLDPAHVARYDGKMDAEAEAEVRLLQRLGLDAGSTVLDIGAGTGQFTLAVAPVCRRVIAADISPVMLARLRSDIEAAGVAGIECVQAGLLTYEHQGDPVDFAYCRLALHHLPDFWKAIALVRITGLLRPGGVLRLSDVVYGFDPEDAPARLEAWCATGDENDENIATSWTRPELEEHVRDEHSTFTWLLEMMITRAGLAIEEVSYSDDQLLAKYVLRKPLDAR